MKIRIEGFSQAAARTHGHVQPVARLLETKMRSVLVKFYRLFNRIPHFRTAGKEFDAASFYKAPRLIFEEIHASQGKIVYVSDGRGKEKPFPGDAPIIPFLLARKAVTQITGMHRLA
ncbi:MAG: hypothetical protein BWY09_02436 [Candidatus Hydrogenedentes bacterium ADurb.Bin179]|nr:MAG: hypothetical protein BWY09_02436 [Candidatus Hydrogenedentes bacterium ADurb.Bin179]